MKRIGRIRTMSVDDQNPRPKPRLKPKGRGSKVPVSLIVFLFLIAMAVVTLIHTILNLEYTVTVVIQEKQIVQREYERRLTKHITKEDLHLWKINRDVTNMFSLIHNTLQVDSELYDMYDVGEEVTVTIKGNKVVDVESGKLSN